MLHAALDTHAVTAEPTPNMVTALTDDGDDDDDGDCGDGGAETDDGDGDEGR